MTAATNVLTGRLGVFVVETTRVARITQWDINPTLANTTEWGDSDGAGQTLRAAGRRDKTFNAEGKFATDNEVWDLFQPGDEAIAVLWMNATLYWDFPAALCMDFNLTVNVDTEEVIGWTSGWGQNGVAYYPGQSGATSRTLP
jgi:hypothetical protein